MSLAVAVSDTGAGTEAAGIVVPIADTATAGETASVAASLTDAGAGSSALTLGAVAVSFGEPAAGSDTITAALRVSDAGSGVDSLSIPAPGATGTGTWRPGALPDRWRVSTQDPRWAVGPLANRWTIRAVRRWAARPADPRWRATLVSGFTPIAAISLQEVNVLWTSDLAGTVVDPTVAPLVVQMAFPPSSGSVNAPAQPVTWYPASWLAGSTGKGWVAQCLVGPGGAVTLTAGQSYDVWSQVQGSPETPKVFAGVQQVY
jgi:hypothetical protein